MDLTINDFLSMGAFPNHSIQLNQQQRLVYGKKRWIKQCQSSLHRIPIIRQASFLRQQRLNNRRIKCALLLAVAQEYGRSAAEQLSRYPQYWSEYKPLYASKINQLAKIINHSYQPMSPKVALPCFINNSLLKSSSSEKQLRLLRQLPTLLKIHYQSKMTTQRQLQQAWRESVVSDKQFKSYLQLSSNQRLVLIHYLTAYQQLPKGKFNRALPFHCEPPKLNGSDKRCKFSQLPIKHQLTLISEAAASRAGYRKRTIDTNTQQLLKAKGLPSLKYYYSPILEKQLSKSNHRLKFIDNHLYSMQGLSARFIVQKSPQGNTLTLTFGGFRSHPLMLGRLWQFYAILCNFIRHPELAPLYQQAAALTEQVACYARNQGFTSFNLLGHSLGGSLAEYSFRKHSELIDRTTVFQAFHLKGKERYALIHHPTARQKITSVEVQNDWITSPLIQRDLRGIPTVLLVPPNYRKQVHSHYHKRLFKAVIDNLSSHQAVVT